MPSSEISRRTFIGGSAAGLAAAGAAATPAARGANDRITVGMIAAGSRAHELLEAIKRVEGTEIVGVYDAYKGRVERAIERTGGRAKAYPDWQSILADKSIDVVTIASPDHWHKAHVIAALEAGKDVYCEKPLTYTIEDGLEIAAAVKKTGRLLQVGSQGISSLTQKKAREMVQTGKLGKVTMVRASYNRNTASGAWIYPIPPDASPETVDWQAFLGPAKKRDFDLERFFRWRCYKDYSGGIATDLFVHLCTTIHYVMGAKMPSKVTAMGQLYRWKESRDVPDTLNAILEYPEGFTVNLGSTFNNQSSAESSFQFLGTEGSINLGSGLSYRPERVREDNGWIVRGWPSKMEQAYYADPKVQQAEMPSMREASLNEAGFEMREEGPDATVLHFENFFESVRNKKPTVEDEWAGHRAAACAHLVNYSVETGRLAKWDFKTDKMMA